MKRFFLIFVLTWFSQLSLAKDNQPLLMENKKSLFQRVLSLPGAKLFSQAKETQKNSKTLPVFTVYYVYARKNDKNNQPWVQVGLGRYGKKVGWIKEEKTLEWSQRLTLTFREPVAGQDRVLLFKDKKSAENLATSPNLKQYKKIYQAASKGKKLVNSPVVAIQPAESIDIRNNFYLIPIHSYDEIFMRDSTARLLQVSSIPLGENELISTTTPEPKVITPAVLQNQNADNSYAAGITFVIDSTLSMQPYIDRTKKAVKKIFNDIKQANLLGNVSFGLIAFRDNINIKPDIGYVTKQYVSLKQGKNPNTFMKQVTDLKATFFSSQGFVEDGFAGVHKALQEMDWSPFAARYIVLVTDASSRDGDDPLSSTGMNLKKLRKLAQEKNVAIFVMHLLTPSGLKNHKIAEKQYKSLSNYPDIGDLYYEIPTGNTNQFGQAIENLSSQITAQVGQMKKGSSKETLKTAVKEEVTQAPSLKSKVEKLGYAFRMKYIKKNKGEQAPNVFKAWIVDKDFQDPEKKMVDVRVLLTRNQLSDLHIILKQILDTAEKGVISPKSFLNELKSLAATTSRNPDRLGGTTETTAGVGQSLAEMGFMREYIEGLPYTGEVMNVSLDDWQSWPVKRQIEFLQGLENKINYYRNLHENVDLWVSLKKGSIDGDSVFPVPLDMLP